MKTMTYKAAQKAILDALAKEGWITMPHLKTPYAMRHGGVHAMRVWFKPRSIYAGLGSNRSEAHSLFLDPKKIAGRLLAFPSDEARASIVSALYSLASGLLGPDQ